MGYSSRFRPPTSLTTARLLPSGDQSAHCTFSSTSLGAPPASGALASVPTFTQVPVRWVLRATAISPVGETANNWVCSSPRDRDSAAPGRALKTSTGLPCHAALYKMVCPSEANRAERISPRRNVISWYLGFGNSERQNRSPATPPAPAPSTRPRPTRAAVNPPPRHAGVRVGGC